MQAFALPNAESPDVAACFSRTRKNCDTPNPNAPSPPKCSNSRRVNPSQSLAGVPRIRIIVGRLTVAAAERLIAKLYMTRGRRCDLLKGFLEIVTWRE